MNDIVLEVASPQIEDSLMALGRKCDVDLYHIPFSKFTIKVYEDEKCKKDMLNHLADMRLNRLLKDDNSIDTFKKIALKNEIIKQLKIDVKKSNTDLDSRMIDVEIKDNVIFLDYDYLFKAKVSFDKMKFNTEDDDFQMLAEMSTPHDDATEKQMQILGGNTVAFVFGLFAFMTTTKNKIEPTRQKVSKNTKSKNDSKNKKNTKNKSNKNKKKYIYNYKIDNNFLNTNKIINKNVNDEKEGKREYHLDSWYRRGHWRTYKSGKKVWIEAQFVHAHNISKNNDNNVYRITKVN